MEKLINTFNEKDFIDCGSRWDAMHGVSTDLNDWVRYFKDEY